MGQALYRKYRSKKLSEIVGQEHITKTLDNALKSGKLSHAYLFTGPRGVGKTSIARILAHEINNLPYSDESMHLDIIEIDAASNRRIDEIRDLRDKVHIAPTSAKYKVYIIDEVHMLTKEAFNALLKTLEEPPAHVVFILATTELHKLPETIVSRTQRFTFRLIDNETIASHLKTIAKDEGMEIDDEALSLIAAHGRGSFRDSISLLDQVGHSQKKVSRSYAEKLVGLAADDQIASLLTAVFDEDPAKIINEMDGLISSGVSPAQIAHQLSVKLRRDLLEGKGDQIKVELLGNLLGVSGSPDPAGELEVALFKAQISNNPPTPTQSAQVKSVKAVPAEVKQAKTVKSEVTTSSPEPVKKPDSKKSEAKDSKEVKNDAAENTKPKTLTGEPAEWWQEVLKEVKAINNTLYGVMRMAVPLVDGEDLRLGFKFGLHAKKASEAEIQAKLHDAVHRITGQKFNISAIVDKNVSAPEATEKPKAETKPVEENNSIDSIKNIFGGGEVLES